MRVLTAAGTEMEHRMLLLASSLSLPFRTDPVRMITSIEGFGNVDGKGVMLLVPCEILHAIDNVMGVSAEADHTNISNQPSTRQYWTVWTALASDPIVPGTPNKVPNWLEVSRVFQYVPVLPVWGSISNLTNFLMV